ncbi:MAG TPA: radical SAM protein [Candidatus Nanoarchaeia archaeon]|nr:radical SAM protein [Candidatus Nanoarchaeia archaeon]
MSKTPTKVCLINTPELMSVYGKIQKYIPPTAPPLGLLYIAAVLEKHGFPVKVTDSYAEHWGVKETIRETLKYNPDIVGITATTPTFGNALMIAKALKKENPKVTVVMGGPHITPTATLLLKKYKEIDVCVKHEGEYSFLELAQNKPLASIVGIVYRKKNGEVVNNPDRPLLDNLDELPYPARHLIDLSKYHHVLFTSYGEPLTEMLTARGCPFQCTFCASKITNGVRVRFRSVKNVMGEVDELINKYGIKVIEFRDDTLTLNPPRFKELMRELKKRKISFIGNGKVNMVAKVPEMAQQFKEAGGKLLMFGCESGEQKILDSYLKAQTVEEIREAFRIVNQHGIDTLAFFILGSPLETRETARKTLNLAKEIKPTFVEFFLLNPHPGTKAEDEARQVEMMTNTNWEEVSTPQWFNPTISHPVFKGEELQTLLKQAYREFYFRPQYMVRLLLKMNTWDKIKRYSNLARAMVHMT